MADLHGAIDALSLPMDTIMPTDRLRATDPDQVAALAQDISARGLLQPVIVHGVEDGGYQLIAGQHRLEAFRTLGLDRIPALLWGNLDDAARLEIEIQENLCRQELNRLQVIQSLVAWRESYQAAHPELKRGRPLKNTESDSVISFTEHAAARTGYSTRNIEIYLGLGGKLSAYVFNHLQNHSIADRLADLKELASFRSDQQKKIVNYLIAHPGVTSIKDAAVNLTLADPAEKPDEISKTTSRFVNWTQSQRDTFVLENRDLLFEAVDRLREAGKI